MVKLATAVSIPGTQQKVREANTKHGRRLQITIDF